MAHVYNGLDWRTSDCAVDDGPKCTILVRYFEQISFAVKRWNWAYQTSERFPEIRSAGFIGVGEFEPAMDLLIIGDSFVVFLGNFLPQTIIFPVQCVTQEGLSVISK